VEKKEYAKLKDPFGHPPEKIPKEALLLTKKEVGELESINNEEPVGELVVSYYKDGTLGLFYVAGGCYLSGGRLSNTWTLQPIRRRGRALMKPVSSCYTTLFRYRGPLKVQTEIKIIDTSLKEKDG
jgi:hypothetical protein